MENEATGLQPVLSHAEPVLAVKDISETISYWQDVLGFPAKWTWGDHASFYYVKDVLVHPDWQGKRIGSAMMQELTNWLEKHAANNALVALICRETLEPFYQQFGFGKAFSMIRYIHHANHHE